MKNNRAEIKSYNVSELGKLYKVHRNTMRKWLAILYPILGDKLALKFLPKQVALIFKIYGRPIVPLEGAPTREILEKTIDNLQDQLKMLKRTEHSLRSKLASAQAHYHKITHRHQ